MSEKEQNHPAEMKIREARSDEDYHAAFPLIRQLFPHLDMQTYARRVFVARATGYRMFVAEIGVKVIGVIGIIPNHNIHDGFVTYIEHVVVDKEYRGQGYGGQLIQFAEQRAREEGCHLIELDTDIGNENVNEMYEHNGYKQSGYYFYKDIGDDSNSQS